MVGSAKLLQNISSLWKGGARAIARKFAGIMWLKLCGRDWLQAFVAADMWCVA